eukprot:2860360-Pleurochrysis_carterae.AAC.2
MRVGTHSWAASTSPTFVTALLYLSNLPDLPSPSSLPSPACPCILIYVQTSNDQPTHQLLIQTANEPPARPPNAALLLFLSFPHTPARPPPVFSSFWNGAPVRTLPLDALFPAAPIASSPSPCLDISVAFADYRMRQSERGTRY